MIRVCMQLSLGVKLSPELEEYVIARMGDEIHLKITEFYLNQNVREGITLIVNDKIFHLKPIMYIWIKVMQA